MPCGARAAAPGPAQMQNYALSDRRVPGGNRGRRWEGGGGAKVGGAFTLDDTQCAGLEV
jgi:hypothetical protein